jgi:hypothetical protein
MNAGKRGRLIKTYVSMLVLTVWVLLIAGVSIAAYPAEATRLPNNADRSVSAAQPVAAATTEQENAKAGLALIDNQDSDLAKWTFIVYIAADDDTLEEAVIADFKEMASIGSNNDLNIVVQLDRPSRNSPSHDNWTDCRRFLVTKGLTTADGNEMMNIGEVNMGDPNTLVGFVEWAASNYPAEKYALIISSHGKGWEGCCWDETSDDDNLDLAEMRSALSDISAFMGRPLDVIGFDACLMGTTEVAYEVHDYASVMVASEQTEPLSGWPYDAILTQLTATPDINAAELATIIVDSYYLSNGQIGYTMSAVDLTKIDAVVNGLNDLAQALIAYNGTDTQAVKNYASTVITTLDEAVIYERHGANWPDSHGLAIYFPKFQNKFDPAYTAGTVSLAGDTAWDEFIIGYYTYAGENWITAAKGETQQYLFLENVDLYEFCRNLIDSEP